MHRPESGAPVVPHYNLCVVGAGITGLNALFVASEYLPSNAKVALIDSNPVAGGMWTEAYDYVRLHQPHGMFTVGDLKWNWTKPKTYLAKRDEVAAHLQHCLAVIRPKVSLTEMFGHTMTHSAEVAANNGFQVAITCQGPDGPVHLRADRMIDARGFDLQQVGPLAMSSDQVVSITPNALNAMTDTTGPLFIVGGGKTGMDTVLAALVQAPDRPVTLINGAGTVFANREQFLPDGIKRYWTGDMFLTTFGKVASQFNGDNEDEVYDAFAKRYTIGPGGKGQQYLYGLLSVSERDRIVAGLTEVIPDYMEDVIDTPDGPQMQMRSGATRAVPAGAVIVNCTGQIFVRPREPQVILSPQNTILRITATDAIYFLSTIASYFLSHLFFMGTIRQTPLALLDLEQLFRKNRRLFHMATATQAHLNTVLLIDAVPFKVADRCGLDFDRWYPLHRRLFAAIDVKRNRDRYVAHGQESLARVNERCGLENRNLTNIS